MKMIKSWDDVDLKLHKQLYDISVNAFDTEEDKQFKTAALLHGITYDELLEQPITATTQMIADTAFLYEKPKVRKIKREYTLNGRKYCPFRDFTEMTTSQYIDYQAVVTEKFEEHLIQLMSILLLPKGHIYNDGEYDSEQQMADIETLSVTEALGLADFFIKKYRRWLMRTLLYCDATLRTEVMLSPKEMRQELKEKRKQASKEIEKLRTMFGSLSLKRLLR